MSWKWRDSRNMPNSLWMSSMIPLAMMKSSQKSNFSLYQDSKDLLCLQMPIASLFRNLDWLLFLSAKEKMKIGKCNMLTDNLGRSMDMMNKELQA